MVRLRKANTLYNPNVPALGDILGDVLKKRGALREMAEEAREAVEAAVNDRAPKGMKKIKKGVIDFYSNPAKYLDFSGMEWNNYNDRWHVKGMSLEQAVGIKHIGNGCYADVYEIDDKRVLKIIKAEDEGYARFVELVRNSNNPHFPRIFYSGVWGGRTVYVLERLSSEPPVTSEHRWSLNEWFREAIKSESGNPYITQATKHLKEAAKLLQKNCLLDDFHSNNMMWRGDVPVITDPSTS